MKAFDVHTGKAVCLRRDNIDTDQIVPAEFCRRITKTGFGDALFANWRKQGGFVLDDPAHAGACFLIAGSGFGIGSSREHAVWALRDYGFRAVIASSFGEIFRMNALGNGMLPIALPSAQVSALSAAAESRPGLELMVDLVAQEVRYDARILHFEIEPRARRMILGGLDEIAASLDRCGALDDYEAARPTWRPRLRPGAPG